MLSGCFDCVDDDVLVESGVKNFEKIYKKNLTVESLNPYLITQIVVKKIMLLQAELSVRMMMMAPFLQIKRPLHLNKFIMVLVKEYLAVSIVYCQDDIMQNQMLKMH